MADYTRFTRVAAKELKGLLSYSWITMNANYTLTDEDRAGAVIVIEATEASKTFTLDLPAGTAAIVYNNGTNAFTLKNVPGDTGISVASKKAYLVLGSTEDDDSVMLLLNDGT